MLPETGYTKMLFPEQEPRALFWTCGGLGPPGKGISGSGEESGVGRVLGSLGRDEQLGVGGTARGDGVKPHVEAYRHSVFGF